MFNVLIFNLLLFLLVFSHVRAMIADPGIVPLSKVNLDFSDLRIRRGNRSDSDSDVSRGGFVVSEFLSFFAAYENLYV